MQIIVQRISSATLKSLDSIETIGKGIIVFLDPNVELDESLSNKIAKKLLKIRYWDAWSKNVVDLGYEIVISPTNDLENACKTVKVLGSTLAGLYSSSRVFVCEQNSVVNMKFINDGPCTLLLDF